MATLYPVWRGSLTYHDGTLSFDGAALYRGTQQGEDDPAPDAIAGVSVGLSPGGIGEGQSGAIALTQRANTAGINQWAAGVSKLTTRAVSAAIADAAMGSATVTTCATVATMGELLAMGAIGLSSQLSVTGLDTGATAAPALAINISQGGINAGQTGALKLTQGLNASSLNQWTAGNSKLTSRAAPVAIADVAMGSATVTTFATVATMGELLAIGALDLSSQISLVGLDTGAIAAPTLDINISQSGIAPGVVTSPVLQLWLTPSGLDQQVFGNQKTTARSVVGVLGEGQQGAAQLKTKLVQAPTAFTGATGTPVAKYAKIVYPDTLPLPASTLPAMTIRLGQSGLAAPVIPPFVATAFLNARSINANACGSPKAHRRPLPSPAARDLLPPSVTRLEHLTAAILASGLTPEVITSTRFADTCPAPLLPWLAWARSVDWWELAESEDQQRALIRASFRLHQHKGTPWAIKEALNVLGYGDSTIIERATGRRYDGTLSYNGNEPHGDPTQWAVYRVILARPVTTGQANRIKRLLAEMAPARCHLSALDYTQAPVTYNGAATYNGNYNHGAT